MTLIPKERQTVMFSATQTKKIEDLIRLSMKDPIFIGMEESMKTLEHLE